MPFDFLCTCGKRLRAREQDAGRRVRCSKCGAELLVPDPPEGDGPTIYDVEVEPAATAADASPFPFPAPPPPAAGPMAIELGGDPRASLRSIPPEPWYYSYLVGYAYLIVIVGVLQFGAVLLGCFGAMGEPRSPGDMMATGAVLTFLVLWSLIVLIGCGAAGGLILLAVDAARNVRANRYRE